MTFFRRIAEYGVSYADSKSEKRNINLTNRISMLVASATIVVFVLRTVILGYNSGSVYRFMTGFLIFLCPLFFNRRGFLLISRFVLCWMPPAFVLMTTILGLKGGMPADVSLYVGLRFFLLAFACFPFLIFNLRNPLLLAAGSLGPLLSILFFDVILNSFDVGFWQMGLVDKSYDYNNVRALASLTVISVGFYFLKRLIEKNEVMNDILVEALSAKTKIIEQQARDEVHQLNQRLHLNLQQLSEREFILNQSQKIARIGSWEYRIEHSFIFWSDEMYNIFGLDKSINLKAQSLASLMLGEDGEVLTKATLQLLRTGESYDFTLRTKTPLGYHKWVRLNAFPILEGSNVIGVRGVCHDITYYKEVEEMIRTSENKYRSLFEQASDFIMILDFKGNFIDVNASLCSTFGYSKDELMQLKIEALIDPKQLRDEPIRYKELEQGDHVLSQRRMMFKDGTIIHVEANVKKLQEDRMLVIARDITKFREAQIQVQISEARFRGAFEYSAIGMALVSLEGRWLKVNRELCNIIGYTEEELFVRTFQEITHAEDVNTDLEFLQQILRGEMETYRKEKRYIHKHGRLVWVNLNVSLIRDNHRKPLYFVTQVEDITNRKAAEEKFLKAFDLSPDLMVIVRERDLVFVEVNKKAEEMLGFARKDMIGFNTEQQKGFVWVVPEEREIFYKKYYSTGSVVEEAEIQKMNGERFYATISAERMVLAGESNMIMVIRDITERRENQRNLLLSQANLSATINNTEVLIWSVDRDLKLLTFNKPFFNYIKNQYGRAVQTGSRVFASAEAPGTIELTKKWRQHYFRALSGEILTIEETRFGIDFQYSLSPIVEGDRIIGVSVFADNITERNNRDRELAKANKKIGELKLMALRSVMSPHFIFNVLNSIQFFIAKNDRVNAINYLSSFSKLIRSVLSHSVDNKIKLLDEIEMLKNYVHLEMVRFENKFTFELKVDESVDVEMIEVPSLLIQPFVENAILHGLYNKTGQGALTIRISETESAIVFEVEDNGIGRQAAMKLRQKNLPLHKSMGIKLTEERLRLINEGHNVAFEVQDLMQASEPCGTLVRIKINNHSE